MARVSAITKVCWLSLWMAVAIAACARPHSVADRKCPCATSLGYICCPTSNLCVTSLVDECPPERDVNQCQLQDNGAGIDGGTVVSDDPTTPVVPVACGEGVPPLATLSYAPGYTPDATVVDWVMNTLDGTTLADRATQMRGTAKALGTAPARPNYSDIQRSHDTTMIRGFRYRDGPRGMNLGEDMDGERPDAAQVNGSDVGYSTAFPVSIARAAAFDVELENAIGEAIGDEMQAANQTALFAPCVNLLRHPLWGRAQETYGEDPFESGRLGSAMAVGAQQHVLATAKHFVAYAIEHNRDDNDSDLDEQTLRETYGRPFRMVIQDGGVGSIMASVNAVNGVKSALNAHLLTDILRNDFGFKGFVVSDFWPFWKGSAANVDVGELKSTAVRAVRAGLDVELPWSWSYAQLEDIVSASGGLTIADVNVAAARILEQKRRFKADGLDGCLGLGAPKTHYSLGSSVVTNDGDHALLAQRAALESMVLLKNEQQTLPIALAAGAKVVVLGAAVSYTVTDVGSNPSPSGISFATDTLTGDLGASRVFPKTENRVGPFKGIQATAPSGVTVAYGSMASDAKNADFVVVVAGLTPKDEGEEFTGAGDRMALALDAKDGTNRQNKLITDVVALKKPMVVVLEGGSVIDLPWLDSVPAVVMAWYPGQGGGAALGQLLWGRAGGQPVNFSGKLPLTWSKLEDYPPFRGTGNVTPFDYDVGYRFFDRQGIAPLFPFGYGLSYTTFEYRKLQLGCSGLSKGGVLPVVVNVANTGSVAGDETVMVFVSFPGSSARRPLKELKGFARIHLAAGEEKQLTIPVRLADLDYFKTDSVTAGTGTWVVESGELKIMVGGSSTNLPLSTSVTVDGYASPPS